MLVICEKVLRGAAFLQKYSMASHTPIEESRYVYLWPASLASMPDSATTFTLELGFGAYTGSQALLALLSVIMLSLNISAGS